MSYRCNTHVALQKEMQHHAVAMHGVAFLWPSSTDLHIHSVTYSLAHSAKHVSCLRVRNVQFCMRHRHVAALCFIQSNAGMSVRQKRYLTNLNSILWYASCREFRAKLGQKCRMLWPSSKLSKHRTWHSCRSSLMASRRPWTSRRLLRRRWNRSGQSWFLYCSCHIATRIAVLSCHFHHDSAHL